MAKTLKVSIIISACFLILIRLEPIWERYPGGFWNLLVYLIITVLFFWIVVKIIIEIIRLIKHRKVLKFNTFLPICILFIVILDVIYNPLAVDFEKVYGKVVFKACYEGTQNQATFQLRENGKFDIHSTGVFFSDYFYTGKYKKNGDTLLMQFQSKTLRLLGDTLIIKDEYLFLKQKDTLLATHFYLGECKGLN